MDPTQEESQYDQEQERQSKQGIISRGNSAVDNIRRARRALKSRLGKAGSRLAGQVTKRAGVAIAQGLISFFSSPPGWVVGGIALVILLTLVTISSVTSTGVLEAGGAVLTPPPGGSGVRPPIFFFTHPAVTSHVLNEFGPYLKAGDVVLLRSEFSAKIRDANDIRSLNEQGKQFKEKYPFLTLIARGDGYQSTRVGAVGLNKEYFSGIMYGYDKFGEGDQIPEFTWDAKGTYDNFARAKQIANAAGFLLYGMPTGGPITFRIVDGVRYVWDYGEIAKRTDVLVPQLQGYCGDQWSGRDPRTLEDAVDIIADQIQAKSPDTPWYPQVATIGNSLVNSTPWEFSYNPCSTYAINNGASGATIQWEVSFVGDTVKYLQAMESFFGPSDDLPPPGDLTICQREYYESPACSGPVSASGETLCQKNTPGCTSWGGSGSGVGTIMISSCVPCSPFPPPPSGSVAGFWTFGSGGFTLNWIKDRDGFLPYLRDGDIIFHGTGKVSDAHYTDKNTPRNPWRKADIDAAVALVRDVKLLTGVRLRLGIRTTGLQNMREIAAEIKRGTWGNVIQGLGQSYEAQQGDLDFRDPRIVGIAEARRYAIENFRQQRAITDDAGIEFWQSTAGMPIKSGSLPYGEMAKFTHVWMPQFQADLKDGDLFDKGGVKGTWNKLQDMMREADANPREFIPQNTTIGDRGNGLPGGGPWPGSALPLIVKGTRYMMTTGARPATGWITQYFEPIANKQRMVDMLKALGR